MSVLRVLEFNDTENTDVTGIEVGNNFIVLPREILSEGTAEPGKYYNWFCFSHIESKHMHTYTHTQISSYSFFPTSKPVKPVASQASQ